MEIQQALADQGYYSGDINGVWGPESVEALKRFQADQNLTVDGKLGALSIIALGLGPKRQAGDTLTTKPDGTEQQ
jgi:peptidoglycan hydrolase-like protein with peptidoglycan-binding domain